jgi:hypothetical protein
VFALSLLLGRPGRRTAAWDWLRDQVERTSPVVALAASVAILWLALTYGARVASGADTFGYVSQACLWLKGDLHVDQPVAADFPWPLAVDSVAPLGYRPGPSPNTIVPTYSPGLPLIMAFFYAVLGYCGPYYVQAVFGGLLIAITFGLAYRVSQERLVATLAAVFMAGSPAFVFNLMTPMSDTVTAALWAGSLLLLTFPGIAAAAIAGCLAALAVIVRPNLVPLVIAGVLATALWPADEGVPERRWARAVAFLSAVIPAAVFIAVLNNDLYGSPAMSGYGPASSLYGVGQFPGNVQRYSTWLLQSEGPFVLLAALPLAVPRLRPAWLTRARILPAAALVAILCLSYVFYVHFRDWWYLRFFLPAFPVLFILMAAPLSVFARSVPAVVSLPALVLTVALALGHSLGFTIDYGTLNVGRGENRYVAVADYIERELPPTAVIFSMQHSGTVRFYSGRMTLRYDSMAPEQFKPAIEWLAARNYRPYILLENWEETDYMRHFAGQGSVGTLDMLIVAELRRPGGIRLYDPLQPSNGGVPPAQIVMPFASRCVEPRDVWGR